MSVDTRIVMHPFEWSEYVRLVHGSVGWTHQTKMMYRTMAILSTL